MKKGIFVKLAGFEESCWVSEFEFAQELGCDHVEFVLDYPLLGPSAYKIETLEKIRKMAKDLKLIVHLMPHRYNQVSGLEGRVFDLASLNQDIRTFSIEEVKKSFEMARELGAEIVTVHGGFCRDKKSYDENFGVLRKSLEELNDSAKGVKLCVENMPLKDRSGKFYNEIPTNPEDLCALVKDLENIGITLDVGHANTIMPPKKYLNKLIKVWNMHVHDNSGKDDHLPLGDGNIDFEDFIRELKKKDYKGYFSLELDINWDEAELQVPSKKERRKSWHLLNNYLQKSIK